MVGVVCGTGEMRGSKWQSLLASNDEKESTEGNMAGSYYTEQYVMME